MSSPKHSVSIIIIVTRSSIIISSFITSLIITKLTPSSSSSSASSSSPTAEPRQTTSLSGFLFVINSHPHQIPTSHQPCSSQPGPGWNRAPDPPDPPGVPSQKRLIYPGNDPPPPNAWFIKDCVFQPPLVLLTKGKLSRLRPAFVIWWCWTVAGAAVGEIWNDSRSAKCCIFP